MTTLADAKLLTLRTQLGAEGHVNDLELLWVQALGATSGNLVDAWFEVFEAAGITEGTFNDRAVAYIVQVTIPVGSLGGYNEHWLHYWLNATLAPAAPMPPLLANLFHWFDFTDVSTLWQDTAGTIPIVDGTDILRVDNKGTSGVPVTDQFPPGPIWRADVITGPTGIDYGGVQTLPGAGFPPSLQLNPWVVGAIPGIGSFMSSFGRVLESPGAFPNNLAHQAGGGGVLGVEADNISLPSAQWAGNVGNHPQPVGTNVPLTLDEWVWVYANAGATSAQFRAAGAAEVNSAGVSTNPLDGVITLGQVSGEMTEVLVYDRALSIAERQLVIDYWDAKYGVAPFFAVPPTVSDLIHHYDFPDNATVFRNLPGTQLSGDGDLIRRVHDKGSRQIDLTSSSDSASPLYRTGVLNGQNIADFFPSGVSKPLTANEPIGQLGASGMSNALVFKLPGALGPAVQIVDWGVGVGQLRGQRDFGAGFMRWDYPGTPGGFSLAVIVPDAWYLWYASFTGVFAGADDRLRLSGEAQQAVAGVTPADILANEIIQLKHITSQDIQVAEWAVWDGPLSDAELTELENYVAEKYGTLPALPVPAPGNLIHHVDPSDASTVWADAAGTIPAVDGGTVLRIDNNGTNGTPLSSATGTPIYRTGVLNGTNVIEFSSARLEALALAAGLTISTTGYTIAMVTRRQASHVGDSILWRWTPFAGTPGPSLRGKFVLDGNFHRADPIADEQLVADPSVLGDWYLLYFSAEAGGATDDAKFGSPGPEVLGPWADLTDIPVGADVRYGTSSTQVQHAEAWFWDRPLTLAERAQLVAYADGKYGTLPHA